MNVFPDMPFEIIDCHLHPATCEANHWGWFLPFDSAESFVRTLREAGISRGCGGCAKRPENADFAPTAASNKAATEFRDLFPDFYIPAIQADPRVPVESCREIEHYHATEGVRWIGELVGYIMGYGDKYDSEGAFQIYDLALQLGMVVNLHDSGLEAVDRMCKAFPRLPFVLAHPGGGKDAIKERIKFVAEHPNLHLDISGTGVTRWGIIRYFIDEAGAEKLLFGTDFPGCTPASFVACVLSEPISDKDREAIFSGNFKRITGVE